MSATKFQTRPEVYQLGIVRARLAILTAEEYSQEDPFPASPARERRSQWSPSVLHPEQARERTSNQNEIDSNNAPVPPNSRVRDL
jgi:hypothetical protein